MKKSLSKMLLCSVLSTLTLVGRSYAQYVVNGKEIDTTFNTAMNQVFTNLDKTKIPYGLLRDYALEFTNLDSFSGTVALDSTNITSQSIFKQIYTTLATARMTSAAYATLPSPNTVDSLLYVARQPGLVILSGLFYQYSYLASNADSTGKITVTNNQLFDKYINGVWQNPYLQGQVVGFAPAAASFNGTSFSLLLPSNLWLSNSKSSISQIQVDAGDGLGYRTITPGIGMAVSYTSIGVKVLNFKIFLSNGTVLQSHSQLQINVDPNAVYGGPHLILHGGGTNQIGSPTTEFQQTQYNNIYQVVTTATYNNKPAQGQVTIQLASGHSQIFNPLIVIEGFDPGYYTKPESLTGEYGLSDFNLSIASSNSLTSLINSQYDVVFVDFRNGTDDIHRNALLVESVIRWVKTYNYGTNKIAVLGLSMGGLCARYALKAMENNGETHNVRLFVCHGSPQQGAEVPVSLQYLETHMNSLYLRAGVGKTLFDIYRIFNPSIPNIDGILTLSNTAAAVQMLITHVTPGYQIDNSAHKAWQTELTGLGYPSQGGIRNVAISNGSECGQTQTLAQNGQIAYVDGKLGTSVWGDLVTMLAISTTGRTAAAITGQPSISMGAIPGRNTISLHFQMNSAADGGGNQVYTGKISYTKTILWLIPVTSTIANRTFNAPAGVYPYETFAGDYKTLPQTNKVLGSSGWFGKYNITLNIAPSFGFIPTPSVLDIGKDTTALVESDYLTSYSQASPPAKKTPFKNFITAYSPLSSSYVNNNEEHISYETRNGNWLVNELKGTPAVADCTALCQINSISGDQIDCSLKTYSVPSFSNVAYNWTVSSNSLVIVGGQGTPNIQVQPAGGITGGQVTLSVKMNITNNPDCDTLTVSRTLNIGIEPLIVNSTVDRTPQSSHYQYLTATATQLANTTASGYKWYLLVNNQPTTLIGTGLQLNRYPIAPCTTIYYQCQTPTPCGTSTYNGYAYNTYCGTGSAASQSVIAYPNPADNTLTVTNYDIQTSQQTAADGTTTTNSTAIPQTYSIKLYNDKGQVLKSGTNQSGNSDIVINTSDVPNGTYYLHIFKGTDVIEKQIVIQH